MKQRTIQMVPFIVAYLAKHATRIVTLQELKLNLDPQGFGGVNAAIRVLCNRDMVTRHRVETHNIWYYRLKVINEEKIKRIMESA